MKIDTTDWEEFEVQKLFDVVYGVNLELVNCVETDKNDPDAVAFVSRTESNNGISAYVKPVQGVEPQPKDTITVAGGRSVLATFLQTQPFYSGRDLYLLYPKCCISNKAKLFLVTIIKANKYRYNYGRQANVTLPSLKLKLPVTADGKPDWQWMESYIDSLHSEPLTTQNDTHVVSLDTSTWKTFGYTEVFKVCKGFYNKKPEPSGEGTIPFLSATSENNGVTEYYTLEEIANATRTGNGSNDPLSRKLFPGHAVCVTNNGSVGFAYYQAKQFTCSHDVNPLYRLDGEFTEATGLFVASVIMKDRYRWAYGRKWRPERMVHSTIDLPATPDGKPDWQWMENYIKSLPYGDRLR